MTEQRKERFDEILSELDVDGQIDSARLSANAGPGSYQEQLSNIKNAVRNIVADTMRLMDRECVYHDRHDSSKSVPLDKYTESFVDRRDFDGVVAQLRWWFSTGCLWADSTKQAWVERDAAFAEIKALRAHLKTRQSQLEEWQALAIKYRPEIRS